MAITRDNTRGESGAWLVIRWWDCNWCRFVSNYSQRNTWWCGGEYIITWPPLTLLFNSHSRFISVNWKDSISAKLQRNVDCCVPGSGFHLNFAECENICRTSGSQSEEHVRRFLRSLVQFKMWKKSIRLMQLFINTFLPLRNSLVLYVWEWRVCVVAVLGDGSDGAPWWWQPQLQRGPGVLTQPASLVNLLPQHSTQREVRPARAVRRCR